MDRDLHFRRSIAARKEKNDGDEFNKKYFHFESGLRCFNQERGCSKALILLRACAVSVICFKINYPLSQKFLPETTVDTATPLGLKKPIKRDLVEFAKNIKIMPIIFLSRILALRVKKRRIGSSNLA